MAEKNEANVFFENLVEKKQNLSIDVYLAGMSVVNALLKCCSIK